MTPAARCPAMVLAAALCCLLLPACSTGTPPRPAASNSSAVTTLVSPEPVGDPFPAQDTPIDRAPAALAALWRPYGVTVIPGTQVFATLPRLPALADKSGGRLGVASTTLVTAYLRQQQLARWAYRNGQLSLGPRLYTTLFLVGRLGAAAATGTRIDLPDCALYPEAWTAYAVSPALRDALSSRQPLVGDIVALKLTFPGPCATTGRTPGGAIVTVETAPTQTLLILAEVRRDPVLGTVLFVEAGAPCDDPVVAPTCAS